MKRLINVTLTAFLVLGICSTSFAQTGTINASADVLTKIEFNNSQPLDFGNISSGSAASVSPGDTDGGSIELTAENSADVTVEISWPTTSTDEPGLTDEDKDLPVNFSYATDPDEDTNSPGNNSGDSDTDNSTTSSIDLSSFDGTGGDSDNTIGVFIGGDISSSDTDGNQGNFNGDITLTATYN